MWTDRGAPRHALITGGGRGIGRLLAQSLAAEGTAVGLIARSANELEETAALVGAGGGVAAFEVADVTDEWSLGPAIARLRGHLGPIDLLLNNAGIIGPVGRSWEVDTDEWWRAMDVNVRGTLLTTHLVLPEMVARQRGRIVNLSSQAGVFRWPLVSAYSVSKAAIVKFTENLALETQRYGVAVFSVHPGLLPIGMADVAYADTAPRESIEAHVFAWVRNELSEGRGADPAAAVDLILRLASGRYDELTGRQLSVHDDIDAVLAEIDDVRSRELYVLGVQRLDPAVEQARRKSA
jgi:NAD(P)-dependent dehydrogenase (short-subunit alcohol dehydrogenase family)